MTTLLCASTHCHLPGIHAEDCDDEQCRGCQRARAADGLYLCGRCAGLLATDASTAAELYDALGQALIGGGGERGRRGSSHGLDLNDAAVEARGAIRTTLVALCRLVAEERGVTLPADDVTAMGAFVGRHAQWLAAHRAAGEHAADLRDLVTDQRSRRVAYASRADRILVGVCNQPRTALSVDPGAESGAVADEPCGTLLYAREELDEDGRGTGRLQPDITCPGCGTVGTVQWWRWEMCSAADGQQVVDAYEAAALLSWRWGRPVDPGLVWQWGRRYDDAGMLRELCDVTSFGAVEREYVEGKPLKDRQGRVLFVLGMVVARAERMWGTPEDLLAKVGG